jgi:cobalt-zinc-cadmium efflux system outer membrane protein
METKFSGRAYACPCAAVHKDGRTRCHKRTTSALVATWLVITLIAPVANAEPAPPYLALFRQAEQSAPRLAESDANVRAAEGQTVQAALRPNPSIVLEAENIGRNSQRDGPSLAQNTLSVAEALEIGGKRPARIAAAGAGLDAARAQREQMRTDFAFDLAQAYMTAELAQKRLDLAMEALSRAQEDERVARALVSAGREADLRSVQANAATTAAQADLESARADVTEALVRLAGLVGVREPYSGVGQSLLDMAGALKPPPIKPTAAFPAVLAAEAARNAAVQRIKVERTRAIPDVTVSLGARRFPGENATAVVAGLSVPLPLFNNNSGAIATASAELSAADARLNSIRLNAEADWRSASSQALAADRRLSATTTAEAAANEAYRLARIGYDVGRTPLAELLTARRNLTEAQLRGLDARVARIRAEAIIARLMGRIPFGDTP